MKCTSMFWRGDEKSESGILTLVFTTGERVEIEMESFRSAYRLFEAINAQNRKIEESVVERFKVKFNQFADSFL